MTELEFMNLWRYRYYGLVLHAALDTEEEGPGDFTRYRQRIGLDEIIKDLLGRSYDSLTNDYRPPKDYLETFQKLGRLGEAWMKAETLNLVPASQCLDYEHVKTMKQLHAVLRAHPEIRRSKPSPQRLTVNAADWARYLSVRNRQAGVALDAAEDYAAAARERQEHIRERVRRAQ